MAAAEPDNSLACELIAGSVVKKQLGVKHVQSQASADSPTATGPRDEQHTVNGADRTECLFDGYDHKASKGELKALHNANKPMPAGFGFLAISTYVRDDMPAGDGENWDPTVAGIEQAAALKSAKQTFGGADFAEPGFGAFLHKAAWIGNKDRTSGFYEVGDGGSAGAVITLSVNVPGGKGPAKFLALAKKIVPNFTNLGL
jgi:hypothetical protein